MLSFPNAKINIGLNIIGKRDDGYHDLESCFYPIRWNDILEIVKSDVLEFKCTGLPISGDKIDNLCLKAYSLLANDHTIGPVNIHLHKVIPMGAGLGGGSSNGAFTLVLVNDLFKLNLSQRELLSYAGELGSDCPFFIINKPTFVTGTGNAFDSINMTLKDKWLTLVKPDISVNTKTAFSTIVPNVPQGSLKNTLENSPLAQWSNSIVNDFQEPFFKQFPELLQIQSKLASNGASYTSLSGTGSTVYGIFEEEINWNNEFDGYSVFQVKVD